MYRGIELKVNQTCNILIWNQTRYHYVMDPIVNLFPLFFGEDKG